MTTASPLDALSVLRRGVTFPISRSIMSIENSERTEYLSRSSGGRVYDAARRILGALTLSFNDRTTPPLRVTARGR